MNRNPLPRLALLACTGALALAACGQPASVPAPSPRPPVSAPQAPTNLGMYTLQVGGLGGELQNLSVRAASAQVPGLSFELLSYGSFVDRTTGMMHLQAVFRVINGSGQDIAAPTYVPVDTASTVGGTPYQNVRRYDGSDASARAPAMSPTVAMRTNLQTGAVEPDPAATPFVTGLGSSEIDLGAPEGTVQGVSRSGWVGDAIPAGGSGVVAFGASIALSNGQLTPDDPYSFDMVFAVADSVAQRGITGLHTVQGSTPSGDAPSPLLGQTVTVEGVVTADFRDGLRGFYLQEADINADRDPNTSEGIFVFCGSNCAELFTGSMVGQLVRVSGPVSEFQGATQVSGNPSTVTTLRGSQTLPAAQVVTLPLPVEGRERLEAMRVQVSGVVTGNFTLGRGGSVDIADDRIFTYTQLNRPSAQGFAAHQAQARDRMLRIDDGSTLNNPPEVFGVNGQPLSAQNTLRGGDGAQVTGVMAFGGGGWNGSGESQMYRVHATEALFTPLNPRPGNPDVPGLRVAAMNVLNYFTTMNGSNSGCTVNGTASSARGANNCVEFERQQAKIVSAIAGMNAAVIGLMEIENDYARFADSSAANLVAALNAATTPGRYAYIQPPGNVGTDAIAVGFIYQPAMVTPVGRLAILDRTVDPTYDDGRNRPTWAHTFQSNENGGRFTAAMVHFKSKGSACGAADPDLGDGQGNCNLSRVNAASALARWLKTDPTGAEGADLLIMGDVNAYAMEDPLAAMEDQGFVNAFPNSAYSYQFDSQWGSLDHILVSPSLRAQMVGGVKWHINADEPTVLDYNTEFKSAAQIQSYYAPDAYRSSDHDPLLIGLQLAAQTPLPPSVPPQPPTPPAPQPTCDAGALRISQVYGGGGNTGAPLNRDFVELFNPTNRAVSTADLSVQYASASGTAWGTKVDLPAGCIPAGGYYLIGLASGSNGDPLPTPDLSGSINMSGTSGKVALLRGTTAFSGQSPAGDPRTLDLVGYGATNGFEGSGPTPTLSNTTAALRRLAGCQDTNDNAADFITTGAPQPRNSASPVNVCN